MPVVCTTVLSIATVPLDISIPVPPEKCALTSEALGPVYVNTPVVLLYAKLPSPPASVTLKSASAAVVKSETCDAVMLIVAFDILPILQYLSAVITGTIQALPNEPAPAEPIVSESAIFPSPLVYVIPLIPANKPLATVLKSETCDPVILTAVSPAAVIKPFAFT